MDTNLPYVIGTRDQLSLYMFLAVIAFAVNYYVWDNPLVRRWLMWGAFIVLTGMTIAGGIQLWLP